jgi:hypothetical protein
MLLNHALRPVVLFNPSNKQHRQYYSNFLKEGSWGKCPVRFAVEGDASNNNLAFAMQRMLTEYYIGKEFQEKRHAIAA